MWAFRGRRCRACAGGEVRCPGQRPRSGPTQEVAESQNGSLLGVSATEVSCGRRDNKGPAATTPSPIDSRRQPSRQHHGSRRTQCSRQTYRWNMQIARVAGLGHCLGRNCRSGGQASSSRYGDGLSSGILGVPDSAKRFLGSSSQGVRAGDKLGMRFVERVIERLLAFLRLSPGHAERSWTKRERARRRRRGTLGHSAWGMH